MKFTLEIKLGNEAMQTTDDVAEALRRVASTLIKMVYISELNDDAWPISDLNGNKVGSFVVKS